MTDKELREASGLSCTQIAQMIGKSRATIYLWENDNIFPESLRITLRGAGATPEIRELESTRDVMKVALRNIEHQLLIKYEEAAK